MTLAFAINAGTALASTAFVEEELPTAEEIITDAIQTSTDDIAEYNGDITDENGKMIVPFDVAYPEAFASGDFAYDTSSLLIKMSMDFDGELTDGLRDCGFSAIEELFTISNTVWYKAFIAEGTDIHTAMGNARENEEILLADYDYIVKTASVEESSTPVIATSSETQWWGGSVAGNSRISEQWYLNSCNIQQVWAALEAEGINAGGSSSVIVAVIDSGVDYTHPDLTSSMWVNKGEIPDNGIDDDGNGYIDDIYGCSTIGSKYDHNGNPMDDNGHGTHVAGIIGASNNKEGIVGIAYNCKIMAIKAGTEILNTSDIAEAILYAYENGAEVINMSFGGATPNLAIQEALELAATRAILVAAAGNDGKPDVDGFYIKALPHFPANLQYVIGVMSVNQMGIESQFSNWEFNDTYNVYAPGEGILSTYPGGKYVRLSGTSMAAPIVSGIAALLRSKYSDRDSFPAKYVTAQICATGTKDAICCDINKHVRLLVDGSIGSPHETAKIVNAYAALMTVPKPEVTLYDAYIFDDKTISDSNNGDGFVDAGETIYIGAILQNTWGMSKDTIVTISSTDPYVEIIQASSNFDGVGTFSLKDQLVRNNSNIVVGTNEPLIVKISKDCPHNYLVKLNCNIVFKNGLNEKDSSSYNSSRPITFKTIRATEIPTIIDKDITLTNEHLYVLKADTFVLKDVTITIDAGAVIDMMSNSLTGYGTVYFNGTENERITVTSTPIPGSSRNSTFSIPEVIVNYTDIVEVGSFGCTSFNYSTFTSGGSSSQWFSADHIYASTLRDASISAGLVEKSEIIYTDYANRYSDYKIKATRVIETSMLNDSDRPTSKIYIAGSSEECRFVGPWKFFDSSSFVPSKNLYSKCIFQNSAIGNPYYSSGGMVDKFFVNDSTKTTYLCVRLGQSLRVHPLIGETIANLFGGHLLCIESTEEYNWLIEQGVSGHCGLVFGNEMWLNGESLETFIEIVDWGNHGADTTILGEFNNLSLSQGGVSAAGKILFYDDYDTGYYDKDVYVIEIVNSNISNITEANDILADYMASTRGQIRLVYDCSIVNNLASGQINALSSNNVGNYEEIVTLSIDGLYWGTTDEEMIEYQILHFNDEPYRRDILDYSGYLTEAPSDTMPFVVDAYLLNQNGARVRTVNNETVTFVVEFNRDMDTSVPLKVSFGSSAEYFYEDYNISEYGNWVTPQRWEATYTLKTVIENGNHTIKVENAQAADDEYLKLYDIPGRFMFEIDTTAAQALIMQGHATETGIQLSWTQDDFDILMGYNVYRSDREDGYYQRLNTSVIPFDQKEFFDDTVEPGKVYYYNFTVVKTDLTESEPSGKISLMSMDTMAPNIYHSPVRSGFVGTNIVVGATITDNLMIRSAALYWRVIGESDWHRSDMTALNSSYTGVIYGNSVTLSGVEYYIEAFDGVSHTYKGSAENPYQISVQQAVDASSLGDVDGDGIITSKDALMLMQAANDLLNLTEEQFLRADINKDKELSAAEALRILQYVSGKITTITG